MEDKELRTDCVTSKLIILSRDRKCEKTDGHYVDWVSSLLVQTKWASLGLQCPDSKNYIGEDKSQLFSL